MRRGFFVILLVFLSAAAFAQTKQPGSTSLPVLPKGGGADGALAAVTKDGKIRITVAELKAEIEKTIKTLVFTQTGQQVPAEQLTAAVKQVPLNRKENPSSFLDLLSVKEVLDSMLDSRLVLQAAGKEKVTVSAEEVNSAVEKIRAQLSGKNGARPTDTEFAQAVRTVYSLDMPAFREQVKQNLIMQKYVTGSMKPPENAEIEKFYKDHGEDSLQERSIRFDALIAPTKAQASDLVKEIGGKTEKFDEYVMNGQSPSAKYRSTISGVLQDSSTVREEAGTVFVDGAFSLAVGQVSPVLEIPTGKAQAGFYIIKVTAKYPAKKLREVGLDSQMPMTQESITVRQYIQLGIASEKLQKEQTRIVEKLRKENPFTIFEQNLKF